MNDTDTGITSACTSWYCSPCQGKTCPRHPRDQHLTRSHNPLAYWSGRFGARNTAAQNRIPGGHAGSTHAVIPSHPNFRYSQVQRVDEAGGPAVGYMTSELTRGARRKIRRRQQKLFAHDCIEAWGEYRVPAAVTRGGPLRGSSISRVSSDGAQGGLEARLRELNIAISPARVPMSGGSGLVSRGGPQGINNSPRTRVGVIQAGPEPRLHALNLALSAVTPVPREWSYVARGGQQSSVTTPRIYTADYTQPRVGVAGPVAMQYFARPATRGRGFTTINQPVRARGRHQRGMNILRIIHAGGSVDSPLPELHPLQPSSLSSPLPASTHPLGNAADITALERTWTDSVPAAIVTDFWATDPDLLFSVPNPSNMSETALHASLLLATFAYDNPTPDVTPAQRELLTDALKSVLTITRQIRVHSALVNDILDPLPVDDDVALRPDSGCVVCYERVADMVLMPCSHLTVCEV